MSVESALPAFTKSRSWLWLLNDYPSLLSDVLGNLRVSFHKTYFLQNRVFHSMLNIYAVFEEVLHACEAGALPLS